MSQTDKEARLANKALVVDPAATGGSENLSTKEAPETEQTTEQEPTQEAEASEATETSKESDATGEATDEDRANREHDTGLRAQYDRVHEVAAAGGDNGENEVG